MWVCWFVLLAAIVVVLFAFFWGGGIFEGEGEVDWTGRVEIEQRRNFWQLAKHKNTWLYSDLFQALKGIEKFHICGFSKEQGGGGS